MKFLIKRLSFQSWTVNVTSLQLLFLYLKPVVEKPGLLSDDAKFHVKRKQTLNL